MSDVESDVVTRYINYSAADLVCHRAYSRLGLVKAESAAMQHVSRRLEKKGGNWRL
jgi:hypothetical protein